ncbi:uncharacterized protein LOC122672204 [Telopea speciosissima]|uniref:uncharacterized protein LOC122672204 n=1 Tax=Telopea speciosissima TaxID=54955 RepID=UPI001CC44418|nr:uncharacterized protein LOC122672204 [Telopea speciosissima]
MAGRLSVYAHMNPRATLNGPPPYKKNLFFAFIAVRSQLLARGTMRIRRSGSSVIRASNVGDSYLDMWKRAKDQERKTNEFGSIVQNSPVSGNDDVVDSEESPEALERKIQQFNKLQEIPKEERDRVQRMQVIDRASAAIAAARALLKESPPLLKADSSVDSVSSEVDLSKTGNNGATESIHLQGLHDGNLSVRQSENFGAGTPGPDFWTWTPPPLDSSRNSEDVGTLKAARKSASNPSPTSSVMEKERSIDYLSIPFESTFPESNHNPPLPPLQSLIEVEKMDVTDTNLEMPSLGGEQELGVLFPTHAAEAAHALEEVNEASPQGVNPDGSRWWKETGTEQRADGVVCRWTLKRGVSADESVEWEEKFWEATGHFEYKELGSEKSGRDSAGNVWREFWKESMWQDPTSGLVHMEKTADKWGKNGNGTEWQEKWWEHYDASGQTEKWAHKWCSIDPNTPLEPGHAHVWHERWGENYDGQGGSMKYTDKWAECSEGDGWSKWGDKWDEHFDPNGHGVKQGEKWWEGKHGDRWNRTWGEGHNGSGWIHKYGKSSSGEHWDTHVQQETWYERYPHFGFEHCLENSVQLREVRKLPETS